MTQSLDSRAWREYLAREALPKAGCFVAKNTNSSWGSAACGEAPKIPLAPSTVGNGYDHVAKSSTGGLIGSSFGAFQSVSGLTNESDSVLGTDYYTLQDNTNFFLTGGTPYTGGTSGPYGWAWEQFIYLNYPAAGSGYAYIQYWLLNFVTNNGACPSTGPPGGTPWIAYSGSCYANGPAALVPLESATNLGSLELAGYANVNSDDASFLCITGGSCYGVGVTSQVLDLYANWLDSEFNVFGAGSGSQAIFNTGASLTITNTLTGVAPTCATNGYTGETNNLLLGPCSTNGNEMTFSEATSAFTTISTWRVDVYAGPGVVENFAAQVSGATTNAGGTITYYFYPMDQDGPCTGQALSDQVGIVSPEAVYYSTTYGPLNAGNYSWKALYSGDSNNFPATSACETFTIFRDGPILYNSVSQDITGLNSVATELVSMGGTYNATGTMTFFESTTAECPYSGATQVGSPVIVTPGKTDFQSAPQTFSVPGTYYWYAVYSGDLNNNPDASSCAELTVPARVTGSLSLSAEPGAPPATATLSNCNVSPTFIVGNGSAVDYIANGGCQVVVTLPSQVGYSRYWFAGSGYTGTFPTCASGTCPESDLTYHYQLEQLVDVSVVGGGLSSIQLTGTYDGVTTTTTLTSQAQWFYLDYGSTASVPAYVAGPPGEQWVAPTASWTITSGLDVGSPVRYYNQFTFTASYSISGGGFPSAPTFEGQSLGSPTSFVLAATSTTTWVDASSAWTITPNPLTASTSTERWETNAPISGIISADTTEAPTYYHQSLFTMSYVVKDGGAPNLPALTSVQFGGAFTPTLNSAATPYWLDDGASWSVTNPLALQSTERWQTSAATSGTVSSTVTSAFIYYHQLFVALSYSVSGGGTGYGAPSLSASLFGVKQSPILTATPTSTWLDAASWTVSPNPLQGSSSTERWIATTTKGTILYATLDVAFYHQYYVTFARIGSGSTPTTGWYNANALVSIKATPASGWKLESWSASPGVTVANPAAANTQMTVTATGRVTATFVPNVALSLSKTSVSIGAGASVPVTATIKGAPQSVTLSFSSTNPGITAAFAVNPVTDSIAGATETVTISVGSGVAAGTYHITMTATGADGAVSSTSVTVKVS